MAVDSPRPSGRRERAWATAPTRNRSSCARKGSDEL